MGFTKDVIPLANQCDYPKLSTHEIGKICKFCGKNFVIWQDFKKHKPLCFHKCEVEECGLVIRRPERVESHKRTHESKKLSELNFSCDFPNCEYVTTRIANIQRHKRESQHEYRKVCAMCKKTFLNYKSSKTTCRLQGAQLVSKCV